MKINIDAPLHQEDIIAFLEKQTEPTFKYLGHPMGIRTTLQFDMDENTLPEDVDDIEEFIKSLIKSQEWSLAMGFHVSKALF